MNTITYDPLLVALSYVISVFGSYTALQLAIVIPQARTWTGVISSVTGAAIAIGGGAIWSMHFIAMNAADLGVPVAYDAFLTFAALMHYTGMAAMIMPAKISYDTTLFAASIVIAIVAATVALWLAFHLRGNLQRFGSALVMGIAVCGMHYTGLYAVQLQKTGEAVASTGISLSPTDLGYSVFGITAALLTLLLIYSAWRSQRMLRTEI